MFYYVLVSDISHRHVTLSHRHRRYAVSQHASAPINVPALYCTTSASLLPVTKQKVVRRVPFIYYTAPYYRMFLSVWPSCFDFISADQKLYKLQIRRNIALTRVTYSIVFDTGGLWSQGWLNFESGGALLFTGRSYIVAVIPVAGLVYLSISDTEENSKFTWCNIMSWFTKFNISVACTSGWWW